jgi:hypothetical protein
MNKFKLFTAIIAFALLSACSTDPLIGKWSITEINYDEVIKTLPAEKQIEAKQELAQNKDKIKGSLVLDLMKDGKLNQFQKGQDKSKENQKGNWKLSKDKKSIELIIKDTPNFSLKIIKNTSKELILQDMIPAGQPSRPSPEYIFEKK